MASRAGAFRPLRRVNGLAPPHEHRRWRQIIRVTAAAVTGAIALSGYAGVVGLLGGEISFGDTIDARLPFGSCLWRVWPCWRSLRCR